MLNHKNPAQAFACAGLEGTVKIDIFVKALQQNGFGVFRPERGKTP